MNKKDNHALNWLYNNGIKSDKIKSAVFFYALHGLFKSNADKRTLNKIAAQYANIVLSAIDRKKTCKDKQYCLLLYSNSIALQKNIPIRKLPLNKRKDVIEYKKNNKHSPIHPYLRSKFLI